MTLLDMANELGYKVSAFHHGVEAYKVAADFENWHQELPGTEYIELLKYI